MREIGGIFVKKEGKELNYSLLQAYITKKGHKKHLTNPVRAIVFERKEGKTDGYLDYFVLRDCSDKLFQVKGLEVGGVNKISGSERVFR